MMARARQIRIDAKCYLITDQIEQITSDGVETSSEHIELDTIVYATGFDIEASFCPFDTFGRNSLKLREYLHEKSLFTFLDS